MTDAAPFEELRPHLRGLAYRMMGSLAEADDVVQDAYLRWHHEAPTVDHPKAWLSRVVTRLCLDRVKSAQMRRERYVGTWLPEPVADPSALAPQAAATELAADLSVALLLTLERMSPLERAAFLLHDVFDADFDEVARVLDRSPAACRQLAARAREHLRTDRPRFAPPPEAQQRLLQAFGRAARTGDVEALSRLLAEDAICYSDGGGKVPAALQPIRGRDRIARFFGGLAGKSPVPPETQVRVAVLNGLPAFILSNADSVVWQTTAIELDPADHIQTIYIVRNPDKLQHLQPDSRNAPAPPGVQ